MNHNQRHHRCTEIGRVNTIAENCFVHVSRENDDGGGGSNSPALLMSLLIICVNFSVTEYTVLE
jgi:hypothetical protein